MGMPVGAEEQPWVADYVARMMKDRKFVEDTMHRIQTEKVFAWAEFEPRGDRPLAEAAITGGCTSLAHKLHWSGNLEAL